MRIICTLGALGIATLLLAACTTVGPDYKKPDLTAPAGYENVDKGKAAQSDSQPAPLDQTAWWQLFDDSTLNDLIARSTRSNLDVEQARFRVVQARADLQVAGAAMSPTVEASGSVTRGQASQNAQKTTGVTTSQSTTTTYKAGFDASWELDLFGGNRRNTEAYKARLEASEENLNNVLLTLLGDVATNYMTLRANQQQLTLGHEAVTAWKDTVTLTTIRYSLGLASYLDVAQAIASQRSAESDLPVHEYAIKQSIQKLSILMGEPPAALTDQLTQAQPMPQAEGVTSTGVPADLLSRRPDMRKSERELAAASADIGVATAGLYPKFDLTLGLGLQSLSSNQFASSSSQYWSIVPGVTIPLYDGGKTRGNIAKAKAVYQEKLSAYRAAFNWALQDVEGTLVQYYGHQAQYEILVQTVAARGEALTLSKERYRLGLTNFIDVLSSQRDYFAAKVNLNTADLNRLTDLVSLYKALGGGWQVEGVDVKLTQPGMGESSGEGVVPAPTYPSAQITL